MKPRLTRVVVADDHVLIRELLVGMLSQSEPACEVVAQVGTAAEAIESCRELAPDLLVLDINMPGQSGVTAVPKIKKIAPKTRVLLCCGTVNERELLSALQAGADGFMEKTNSRSEFLKAVELVLRGENYLCQTSINILSQVVRNPASTDSTARDQRSLTTREKEIISLIAGGRSSKQIASKLFLSLATVETHRANLMTKIQAHNVAQLVRYALDHGLADPTDS